MYKLCNTINVVCSEKKIDYSNVRKCIYIFLYIFCKKVNAKKLCSQTYFFYSFSQQG